jgi:hypothetical protein
LGMVVIKGIGDNAEESRRAFEQDHVVFDHDGSPSG